MRMRKELVWAAMTLALAGCLSSEARRAIGGAERALAEARPPSGEAAADIATAVDRATLEREALGRHPSLRAEAERTRALIARAHADGGLGPPEAMLELWQVPLDEPWAVHKAGMLMLSFRQEFPAAGALDREAEATAHEAEAQAAILAARARDLARDVARAFADYLEAHGRHAAHRRHLALVEQLSEAARARYAAGAPLSDVTEADVERARMLLDIAREEGAFEQARAQLNGLCARAPDAALGPPALGPPETIALDDAELARRAEARSPLVAAAEAMRRAAESAADAAGARADLPTVGVGANLFAPVGDMPFGWGASFRMTLPWLWGSLADRTTSARHRARAEQAAAEAARIDVRTDVRRALAALRTAERRLALLEDTAVPAATRGIEAARAGYAAGGTDVLAWLDAVRASLDIDLDLLMARADLERALADLDHAAAERLPRKPLARSPRTAELCRAGACPPPREDAERTGGPHPAYGDDRSLDKEVTP
jgi:outer membrane protein TolC